MGGMFSVYKIEVDLVRDASHTFQTVRIDDAIAIVVRLTIDTIRGRCSDNHFDKFCFPFSVFLALDLHKLMPDRWNETSFDCNCDLSDASKNGFAIACGAACRL